MSRLRVYIKPFDDLGNYVTDFIEVTDDVDENSLASIKKEIDSTEYNAGVFKFSNFSLTMANEHGKYADVDVFQSIFRYKRTDSIVKVTWNPNTYDTPIAGQYVLVGDDIVIFEGLLSDEATTLQIKDQKIKFQCLGYESLFSRMTVPFSSLSAGDTIDEILLACLNQAPFNSLVTVSAGNISSAVNTVTDAIADLENKTVKEALDELLVIANSVLYIDNNIVYVSDRTESASLQYTFYGQASDNGVENIQDITNVRRGLNRIFNYWTWKDTTNFSQDANSVNFYGVRKKEIESTFVTNTTKQDTILDALRDEFKDPKQEFEITCAFNYTRAQLKLLDKVQVDYPTVFTSADDSPIPVWGHSVWGAFVWPLGQWSITLSTSVSYKIIGITHSLRRGTTTYKIREV